MSKHTPGKWDIVSRTTFGGGWAVVSDHDHPTTTGKTFGVLVAQFCKIDDAHLIAAAPDLLDALEQLLDDMGGDGLCVCQEAKDQARSAIAKARGAVKE